MEKARIFKPSRHVMQSGQAKTHGWVLEFQPSSGRFIEPVMGWTGTRQNSNQVRLSFEDLESAIAYANRNNVPYDIVPEQTTVIKPKSYSANFSPK
jgi:hypothetical protein